MKANRTNCTCKIKRRHYTLHKDGHSDKVVKKLAILIMKFLLKLLLIQLKSCTTCSKIITVCPIRLYSNILYKGSRLLGPTVVQNSCTLEIKNGN